MFRQFAVSLILPVAVLARGKNDASSAESAYTTKLVDDNGLKVTSHNWSDGSKLWVEIESSWNKTPRINPNVDMQWLF